jgi:hypothetical protein
MRLARAADVLEEGGPSPPSQGGLVSGFPSFDATVVPAYLSQTAACVLLQQKSRPRLSAPLSGIPYLLAVATEQWQGREVSGLYAFGGMSSPLHLTDASGWEKLLGLRNSMMLQYLRRGYAREGNRSRKDGFQHGLLVARRGSLRSQSQRRCLAMRCRTVKSAHQW